MATAPRERADGQLIGVVGLAIPRNLPELLPAVTVGWRLAPTAWCMGYATEAATALLDEAFTTMHLARVSCVTQPENVRSVRVAERLGMRLIRELNVPPDECATAVKAVLYDIGAADWLPAGRTERAH